MILDILLFAVLLILPVIIGLAITVPITGAIVRYRANYTPKGLQLSQEPEDDGTGALASHGLLPEDPRAGPVVNGILAMLRRVKRIEGWPGLYKGVGPTFVYTILVTLWAVATINKSKSSPHGQYQIPSAGVFMSFIFTLGALLVAIPFEIILNRTITTPHRLPLLRPLTSLHIILTPYERARPWVLYFTPGLFAAKILHVAWVLVVARTLRLLLVPSLSRGLGSANTPEEQERMTQGVSPLRLILFILFQTLATVVLSPLEVLSMRLSVQRNRGPEVGSAPDAEDEADYIGTEEDVIQLRSEEDPYVGLRDCAERMIKEEGLGSLYRAWGLTMFGSVAGGFA